MKALAKLLDERAVLMSLNLSDNHVHADGGKYFGRALKLNSSLQVRGSGSGRGGVRFKVRVKVRVRVKVCW